MDIVPSGVDLSGAELELIDVPRREYRLREAVQGARGTYDFVIIDCPPALGLLTLNALVGADAVLVPLQAEFYALEGLSHLMRTIDRVRRGLNQNLALPGVVLTTFDGRNNPYGMVPAHVPSSPGPPREK